MSRRNNSGIIAIIITIVIVGGLVYLGVSNKSTASTSAPTATASSGGSMAGHHGTARGATSDPQDLVGKPAPDFSLTGHDGVTYSLASLKGKNVVLFFNEGMMCYPACWNQIASLGSDARFKGENVIALSVVVDSATEWQQAMTKMPELRDATVIHDTGAAVSSIYGMLTTTSSMHYGQLPGHSYVVIDAEGIVRHVYDDPSMAIHNDQLVSELSKLAS